jgi:16S rRNA (guanine1207-N2)-methyltransferase
MTAAGTRSSRQTRFRGQSITSAVYGRIEQTLVDLPRDVVQVSPLIPGSERLEDQPDDSLDYAAIAAPPGVLERRFALGHALRALVSGGRLLALAPKDKGGTRIAAELRSFGCTVAEASRRHHRICEAERPARRVATDEAIAAGGPCVPPSLGLWSQPGIFSWDRPDPGSVALLRRLPPLAGKGADFGCGVGLLARAVLANPQVSALHLVDVDRRAIDAARRNVDDRRAAFAWFDLRAGGPPQAQGLDFVVMNPPFHDGRAEDKTLGETFIRRAAASLRPGGVCWLVANRHLPYEATLRSAFASQRQVEQAEGYKIYEAVR